MHKQRRGTGDGETTTVAPRQIHRGPTGPACISDEQRISEKKKQLHKATSKLFMMLINPKKTWFLSNNHHEPPRPLTKASEKATSAGRSDSQRVATPCFHDKILPMVIDRRLASSGANHPMRCLSPSTCVWRKSLLHHCE